MQHTHDVIVIGGGAAGLTAAGGCGRLGLRTALIERDRLGGECLHTGCVPSKALLATAALAQAMRDADPLGIDAVEPRVAWDRVRAHLDAVRARIAPHDAPERFEAWGVEIVRGTARFVGRRSVSVEGRVLSAPRIVVAVGSRPRIPTIDGLAALPFLTSETLWALDRLPAHLLVLGGGGVGVEMAQAFRRLGARVTLVARAGLLAQHDAEAVAVLRARLEADGVAVRCGVAVASVQQEAGAVVLSLADGQCLRGSHLLVAAGRVASLDGLELDKAGVLAGPDGIVVDAGRRSSNRHVMALGDCRAGPRLTHAAGEDGAVAVQRIGFGLPARVRPALLPAVIYTDPELAQLGPTEAEARSARLAVRVVRQAMDDNDRAVTGNDSTGFGKLVLVGGRPVGVTLVGRDVGEQLLPWSLLVGRIRSLWGLSGAVVAYPTRSELAKALAFATYEERVFGTMARGWARVLARLRRWATPRDGGTP